MKRVGLYLGFPPHGGGVFQYARAILAACKALPQGRFELVVAHTDEGWRAILHEESTSALRTSIVQARLSGLDRFGLFLLRHGLATPSFLRMHALRFFPLLEKLHSLDCDGWIFPAQEHFSYLYPGKTIAAIHDLMHRYEPQFSEVSEHGAYRKREMLYRNICEYASCILVDSSLGKEQVTESYKTRSDQVEILPYIASDHIFHGSLQANACLPDRYILYPAQFWLHKNHPRLLRAFKQSLDSVPWLNLVLVGAPKNGFKAAKNEIRRLGLDDRVYILGYVPDDCMRDLYLRSEGLVMPTFFGPTNIPPLEAMALGVPMSLSDRYAMRQQAEAAALYFDPESEEEMALALVRMATDEGYRATSARVGPERTAQWGQPQFNLRVASILENVFA